MSEHVATIMQGPRAVGRRHAYAAALSAAVALGLECSATSAEVCIGMCIDMHWTVPCIVGKFSPRQSLDMSSAMPLSSRIGRFRPRSRRAWTHTTCADVLKDLRKDMSIDNFYRLALGMYMNWCMDMSAHISTHMATHIYTHGYTHVHTHADTHVYTYVHTHV